MIKIEINEETRGKEQMAVALEVIAIMLRKGYTRGFNPNWFLSDSE